MNVHRPAIFIHSLWRSGSTWLFDCFRQSPSGYWCYQEPFHEALVQLDQAPEDLLLFGPETAKSLRHPPLAAPYFQEFYEIRKALRGKFDPCISYESFFNPAICSPLNKYVHTLIDAARGYPVLQCCRSFGRVAYLKQHFSGTHILLWRDPVSQWFSYQINDYFDTVNLLVLNAQNPPLVIRRIRDEIALLRKKYNSFQEAYHSLSGFSWGAKQRYLVFYALWLYSLIENIPHCDFDLNIDRLSESEDYRTSRQHILELSGISGVDLSDCSAPVSFLSKTERLYFSEVEQTVENLFLECGYSPENVQAARELRAGNRPRRKASIRALRSNAEQARKMALRYADRLADATKP